MMCAGRSLEEVVDPFRHVDVLRLAAHNERVVQQVTRVRAVGAGADQAGALATRV